MSQPSQPTARLPKAYSPTDLMRMNFSRIDFKGDWQRALGNPAKEGVWIVWGDTGSGKTNFAMQLAKELTKHYKRVAYNSLEQGASLSMVETMERCGMQEVNGRFLLLSEPLATLSERLERKHSPDAVIIDSFQYTGLSYRQYIAFKERHRRKLIIFISHAEGKKIKGKTADSVSYDAEMKILVEGYRAICKGRFIPQDGAHYTIWEEGAARYWMTE